MSQNPVPVGILDLCRHFGDPPAEAIWAALELAPRVEQMGYSRYWLAEHYTRDVAHSSPEMLVAVIAGLTRQMRVGTAGVLLRFHRPFKVANDFSLLETIYPGRIDLGLARGGVEPKIQALLSAAPAAEPPYEQKVDQVLQLIMGTTNIPRNPLSNTVPEVWILGSNTESMQIAARNGTAFCLALFVEGGANSPDEILRTYRQSFRPSSILQQARVGLAIAGVCANQTAEAVRMCEEYGKGVVPNIVGSPAECGRNVSALVDRYAADEIVFLNMCRRTDDRERSYLLLAQSLGLQERLNDADPPIAK